MKETTAGYLVLLVHTLQADLLATQQLVLTIAESSPENAGWLEERLHARAESARLVAEGLSRQGDLDGARLWHQVARNLLRLASDVDAP